MQFECDAWPLRLTGRGWTQSAPARSRDAEASREQCYYTEFKKIPLNIDPKFFTNFLIFLSTHSFSKIILFNMLECIDIFFDAKVKFILFNEVSFIQQVSS